MKKLEATKNFLKDKITGRVDIVWRIFKKTTKILKLKLKSQDPKSKFSEL